MSQQENATLSDQIQQFCRDVLGASEHLQIAQHIEHSDKLNVSAASAIVARGLAYDHCCSLLHNLDFVLAPDENVWIEWPLVPRSGDRGAINPLTGCLIMRHPEDALSLMIISGWTMGTEGRAQHSYGVACLNLAEMYEAAASARRDFVVDPAVGIERLMQLVRVYIPEGLKDELLITADNPDDVLLEVARNTSADVPMALAILVCMQVRTGFTLNEGALTFGPPEKLAIIERIKSKVMKPLDGPLYRSVGFKGKPTLIFTGALSA